MRIVLYVILQYFKSVYKYSLPYSMWAQNKSKCKFSTKSTFIGRKDHKILYMRALYKFCNLVKYEMREFSLQFLFSLSVFEQNE